MKHTRFAVIILLLSPFAYGAEVSSAPDGWTTGAPRDEIRPAFQYEPTGGVNGQGVFIIRQDRRDLGQERVLPLAGEEVGEGGLAR